MKRLMAILAAIAGVLAITLPSFAAVDSTDILIKVLVEKGIITEDDAAAVRAEIANIRQEDDAVVARASAQKASTEAYSVSSKRPIKVSGYLQERYTHSSHSGFNDTLEPRRIRLSVSGDATERLDFKTQVDFAGSRKAVTGVDFTNSKSTTAQVGKPLLLDAVIGYRLAGGGRLDVGQFKVPFSIENITSSPYLDLINRSQVVEALVPGRDTGNQGRDIGVQYSATRSLDEEGNRQVQYFAGLFNGSGINVSDDNDRKDVALRAVVKPGVEGLSVAASYFDGATGLSRLAHDRIGGELVYHRGLWTLKSEYIKGKDGNVHKSGWYGTLVRHLNPVVQGVLRLDDLDPNTGVAGDSISSATAGINYFLNKDGYSRLQLNYERKTDDAADTTVNSILAQFQAGF